VGFHRGVTDDLVVSKIRDHAKLLEANPPSYQQLRLLLHRLDPLFQTQDQGLASQSLTLSLHNLLCFLLSQRFDYLLQVSQHWLNF
jgi:hypothetical protein